MRARSLRAQRPGAFEVEGRALGAPRRLENLNQQNVEDLEQQHSSSGIDTEQLDVEANMACVHQHIEAMVFLGHEQQIVYAERATFGMKYLLQERSGRRLLACICLVIIIGMVVIGTVELLKGLNGPQAPELVVSGRVPTGSPIDTPFSGTH